MFVGQTHIVPAELQHGPDQRELLVDLLALQVGEDLLEAVADAVHGHVATEDDAEGKHVEKDAALHWQLLVAGRRLLLRHAVLEGGVVEVHLVNLRESGKGLAAMKLKTSSLSFPASLENCFGGNLRIFQAKNKLYCCYFDLGWLFFRRTEVFDSLFCSLES